MIPWPFRTKFLATLLPRVDRALLALGKQIENAFTQAVDPVLSIAALAGFASVVSAWPEGVQKYVVSVRDTFTLTRTSAPIATDGITVVSAGPALTYWVRDCIPATIWGQQATWFVNPGAVGNDEASGLDVGHPLKTFAEWHRRIGGKIDIAMDLTIAADLPIGDPTDFDVTFGPAGGLVVHGTPSVVGGGTLTARTVRAAAANVPNDMTDATGAGQDWSLLLDKLVHFTSGPAGVYCWVAKDLGANKCRSSVPMTTGANLFTQAEIVLAGNETYTVLQPTVVHFSFMRLGGPNTISGAPKVRFEDLFFQTVPAAGAESLISPDGVWPAFVRCHFDDHTRVADASYLANCCLGSSGGIGVSLSNTKVNLMIVGGLSCAGFTCWNSHGVKTYIFGVAHHSQGEIGVAGHLYCSADIGAFDSADDGFRYYETAVIRLSGGRLYGSGNTAYGVNLRFGSNWLHHGGNAALLTVTGANDVNLAGAAAMLPDITASAGNPLPATSPCATWAQIAAAPFNGKVLNYGCGAYIGP